MANSELNQKLIAGLAKTNFFQTFALLWSFFNLNGLSNLENKIRSEGLSVNQFRDRCLSKHSQSDLSTLSLPPSFELIQPSEMSKNLATCSQDDFEALSMEYLILLEQYIFEKYSPQSLRKLLSNQSFQDLREDNYHIRPAENPIAKTIWENNSALKPTTNQQQGLSLSAFTSRLSLVPKTCHGFTIDFPKWLTPRMHRHLSDVFTPSKSLKILLWPFHPHAFDYDVPPIRPTNQNEFISLQGVQNKDQLKVLLQEALKQANKDQASIVIFPELIVCPEIEQWLKNKRENDFKQKQLYPLLTIFGRSHRPATLPNLDCNQAVILDIAGKEIHCHQKLTVYQEKLDFQPLIENIETGTTLSILESPIGQMAILICLDFIHKEIQFLVDQTHANMLIVPSMSIRTDLYQAIAAKFLNSQLASSFVVNKPYEKVALSEQNTSFYHVSIKKGLRTHFDIPRNPYLLFDITDFLDDDK